MTLRVDGTRPAPLFSMDNRCTQSPSLQAPSRCRDSITSAQHAGPPSIGEICTKIGQQIKIWFQYICKQIVDWLAYLCSGCKAPGSASNEKSATTGPLGECPITQEAIKEPGFTKCGHVFEKVAIYQWLEQNNNCPVCREDVVVEEIQPQPHPTKKS